MGDYVLFLKEGSLGILKNFSESSNCLMYNVILTVLLLLTAELAQKARREIADYVNNGKEERARIRVRIFLGLKSHLQILSYHCALNLEAHIPLHY